MPWLNPTLLDSRCRWYKVDPMYIMFLPMEEMTGALVLKLRSKREGCWKPKRTIRAFACLLPQADVAVLSFCMASFIASSFSSGGTAFQVNTHLDFRIRPLPNAVFTSSSFKQRRTAACFKQELTSFAFALSKRTRSAADRFFKDTSALLSFFTRYKSGSCWKFLHRKIQLQLKHEALALVAVKDCEKIIMSDFLPRLSFKGL